MKFDNISKKLSNFTPQKKEEIKGKNNNLKIFIEKNHRWQAHAPVCELGSLPRGGDGGST